MSGGPVSVTFPNQFPLDNPENAPDHQLILMIFLLKASKESRSEKFKREERRSDADRRRREMDHQKIINQMKRMVNS